ncbi:MAG: DUF5606 domain-containing protein [Flavobacteriaceae bacterium]
MALDKIIAVTGKPGLYEIKAQSKGGFIVESLVDKKRFPITATHNVSVLNDIAIYTWNEEVPLRDVLTTIFEKNEGKNSISHKSSNKELMAFFAEILPEYDTERVYASNIKKVVQWYNLLVDNEFDFASLKEEEKEENA